MGNRAGRRLREILGIGKPLREMTGDPRKIMEFRKRHRFEQHFITVFLDNHLGGFEAKGFRQADGLTPTVLEDLRGFHSYIV